MAGVRGLKSFWEYDESYEYRHHLRKLGSLIEKLHYCIELQITHHRACVHREPIVTLFKSDSGPISDSEHIMMAHCNLTILSLYASHCLSPGVGVFIGSPSAEWARM